jgi:signal transduction histidine kinase
MTGQADDEKGNAARLGALWLASRGSRQDFAVGLALLFAIPMLAVGFLTLSQFVMDERAAMYASLVVLVAVPVFAGLGYAALRKYPANVSKLRSYLQTEVAADLPEALPVIAAEDDLRAIQDSLHILLNGLRSGVKAVTAERDALRVQLSAERARSQRIEALDETRSQFLETVLREVRAPLAPLSSAIELMLGGMVDPITPRQGEVLDLMQRNVERLSGFAADVLHLTTAQSDGDVAVARPVAPRGKAIAGSGGAHA